MTKVVAASVLQTTKEIRKMAEGKLLMFFLHLFGVPIYAYELAINFDNVKGWILMPFAVAYAWIIIDFKRKRYRQILRDKELDLKKKERDMQ